MPEFFLENAKTQLHVFTALLQPIAKLIGHSHSLDNGIVVASFS